MSLFSELPVDQQEKLLAGARLVQIKRGETIFLEGDDAEGFYIICSGKAKIFKLSSEGKEQLLRVLGAGEPIGEVAIFSGEPKYPASAQCLEKSRLYYISHQHFMALIQEHPEIAMNMLGILSRRLSSFAHMIEDLSFKEVSARLARYLLQLSRQQADARYIQLDLKKGQLANYLGTVAETLSRTFGRMREQNIIEMENNVIKLVDIEKLESIAQGEKL